jgi:hypothetical protein
MIYGGTESSNTTTFSRKLLHKAFRPNEVHLLHCTVIIAHFYSAQTIVISALLFSSFSLLLRDSSRDR